MDSDALEQITLTTQSDGGTTARSVEVSLPAELLAQYRVGKLLGQGAMGAVHAAKQLSTDRPVAIKFMLAP